MMQLSQFNRNQLFISASEEAQSLTSCKLSNADVVYVPKGSLNEFFVFVLSIYLMTFLFL